MLNLSCRPNDEVDELFECFPDVLRAEDFVGHPGGLQLINQLRCKLDQPPMRSGDVGNPLHNSRVNLSD